MEDIRVGDMIAFDISHPCLTFDKWRHLPVLNALAAPNSAYVT